MITKTETPAVGSVGNLRVWGYGYYPTGLLQTMTTPDGITLNYQYDARNLITQMTDNLNQRIIYTYDAHKNLIKTDAQNSDDRLALNMQRLYDSRNRHVEHHMPHQGTNDSTTRRLLDNNSNPTSSDSLTLMAIPLTIPMTQKTD